MTTLDITVHTINQANLAIQNLRQKLLTTPALLTQIAVHLQTSTQQRFDTQHSPAGQPWVAHKDAKTKHPLLNKTGHLRNSIAIHNLNALTVTLSASAPYAPHHQFGTKHIPARPFLGISQADHKEIENIIANHFAQPPS